MEATARRLADQPEEGRHGLGQRHLRRPQGVVVEAMGIFRSLSARPTTRPPRIRSTTRRRSKAMYDAGGILTHGRLPENIDTKANKNSKPPRSARSQGEEKNVSKSGIGIDGFLFPQGGYSAIAGFPAKRDAPADDRRRRRASPSPTRRRSSASPTRIRSGTRSPPARRPVTAVPASAIRWPAARSISTPASSASDGHLTEVTTGSAVYTTPALEKPGTYTYFCRIHPFMRGSVRVKQKSSLPVNVVSGPLTLC